MSDNAKTISSESRWEQLKREAKEKAAWVPGEKPKPKEAKVGKNPLPTLTPPAGPGQPVKVAPAKPQAEAPAGPAVVLDTSTWPKPQRKPSKSNQGNPGPASGLLKEVTNPGPRTSILEPPIQKMDNKGGMAQELEDAWFAKEHKKQQEQLVKEAEAKLKQVAKVAQDFQQKVVGSDPMPAKPQLQTHPKLLQNPFLPAEKIKRHLKVLLYGDTGTGKTYFSLQFPKPCVIDLEDGTNHYGDRFKFSADHTNDTDKVAQIIDWLHGGQHDFETLIIDSLTVYHEALQKKWSDILLRRNRNSAGYKFEFYEMQPKDWMTVREEFYDVMRAAISLPMNLIVTTHQKILYAEGTFMQRAGETFDCQKKLPYMVDFVLHLKRSGDKFIALTDKDRTGKLPREFPTNYADFRRFIDV